MSNVLKRRILDKCSPPATSCYRLCPSPTWQGCCPGKLLCFIITECLKKVLKHLLNLWSLCGLLNAVCFISFYNTKSVVMCLGITAAVCLLVTIFSFQTKVRKIVTTCALCYISYMWGLEFKQFPSPFNAVYFIYCFFLSRLMWHHTRVYFSYSAW